MYISSFSLSWVYNRVMKDSLNVHFIAPKTNLADEIDFFRYIVDVIHKHGHTLAKDWLEPNYLRYINKQPDEIIDWASACRANIEAIPSSDVVIAEVSTKSFGVGYQVGLAASQKKPVLLLRREGISKEAFLGGLDNAYVTKAEYNLENIEGIIDNFLKREDEDLKDIRFNMLIDKKLNNYLKQSAIETGKTKAEIIRDLLMKEIRQSDHS